MAHPFEGYIVPVEGEHQDLPVAAPEQQWFVAPDRQQVDYTVPQMLGAALSNAVPSGLKALGGLYNLGKFGVNQLNPFNSREEKAQEAIAMAKGLSQIPSQYARDYGSPKRFMQSFAEDPVGTGLAVAPFLEVLGAASKASSLTKAGEKIGNVAAGVASGPAYGVSRFLSKLKPKNAIYESVLGEKAPIVSEALKAKPNFPKGYKPTAADLAVYADPTNTKFPAMENMLKKTIDPDAFKAREIQNNKAIVDELSSFGGKDKVKAAVKERDAVSGPLYQEAFRKSAPVNEELMTLLNRPAVRSAFGESQTSALNKGQSIPMLEEGATLTGENLHRMKQAIDEQITKERNALTGMPESSAKKGITSATIGDLANAKNALLDFIEKHIPKYRQAREAHAEMSVPVNQAELGTKLIDLLKNAKGEDVQLKANSFLNALKNENTFTSKTTGQSRYGSLDELLTPEQIDSVVKVKNALQNEALKKDLASAGSAAISGLEEAGKGIPNAPHLLSRPLFLYNSAADMINSRLFKGTAEELAQASLNPEKSASNISDFVNRKEIAKGKASKAARNATKVMYFGKAFEDK